MRKKSPENTNTVKLVTLILFRGHEVPSRKH